jgi:hypothetical protein
VLSDYYGALFTTEEDVNAIATADAALDSITADPEPGESFSSWRARAASAVPEALAEYTFRTWGELDWCDPECLIYSNVVWPPEFTQRIAAVGEEATSLLSNGKTLTTASENIRAFLTAINVAAPDELRFIDDDFWYGTGEPRRIQPKGH